jgi:hypothetical protein
VRVRERERERGREREVWMRHEEIVRQNNAGFKVNAARRPGQGHITPDPMLIENAAPKIGPEIFSRNWSSLF